MTTYTKEILSSNLDILKKELNKLNKKTQKYNLPDTTFTITNTYYTQKVGCNTLDQFHTIEINTFNIQIDNYTVIARRDHTLPQGTIVSFLSNDYYNPDWYILEPICDHCGTTRKRNFTYVLRHNTIGDFIIVGKSCLQKFLRNPHINKILNLFEEFQQKQYNIGNGPDFYEIQKTLEITSALINKFGYIKVNECYSTAYDTHILLHNFHIGSYNDHKRLKDIQISPQDKINAQNTINHFLSSNDTSSYVYNLQTIFKGTHHNKYQLNLLASSVQVYFNTTKVKEIKETLQGFFGTSKEKFKNIPLTLISIKEGYTTDYMTGKDITQFCLTFKNSNNNRLQCYTTNYTLGNLEPNHTYNTNFTIKTHKEYKIGETTLINRLKII